MEDSGHAGRSPGLTDASRRAICEPDRQSPEHCYRPEVVQSLAERVVSHDIRGARALLDERLALGDGIEGLLLDYLAPAARLLGDLWNQDHLTFTDVTIGVGRLQDLHCRLSDEHATPLVPQMRAPRALLAPVPGEQHTFGVAMAASLLHGRGWEITGAPHSSEQRLLNAAAGGWFEVIGLSIACERLVDPSSALIGRLREASLNPDVRIVLGGGLITLAPDAALSLGADDLITDARSMTTDPAAEVEAEAEAKAEPRMQPALASA